MLGVERGLGLLGLEQLDKYWLSDQVVHMKCIDDKVCGLDDVHCTGYTTVRYQHMASSQEVVLVGWEQLEWVVQ